jgi:hypothetical protein
MNFLKSFGVWAGFMSFPPLVLCLLGLHLKAVDFLFFLLPFLPIPAAGSILLWLPSLRRDTTRKALLAGIWFGLVVPFLVGLACMKIYPGFENQVAIFAGAWFTAGSSAVGGGAAAGLRSRPKRPLTQASIAPI